MELNDEQRKDLMELQELQQQMQLVALQKQQLLLQQGELEKAGEEVEKSSGQLYRLAGSILVSKDKEALKADLKDELERVQMRLTAFAKQEKKVKDRFEELRMRLEKSLPQLRDAGGSQPRTGVA